MGVAVLTLATGGERLSVMAADSPGGTLESYGLTYAGAAGLITAAVQASVVLAAWSCATWGRDRARKLGLTALLGWAGLWLTNALWLSASTENPWRDLAAWVMAAVFAAMGIRVYRAWPRTKTPPHNESPGPRWTQRPEAVPDPVTQAA